MKSSTSNLVTYSCECGRPLDPHSCGTKYVMTEYSEDGSEIVFAVCSHGFVVVDKRV